MPTALSSSVQISRRFLRSVRIDTDYGRLDALDGFVLQPSSRIALETLARHILETQQRAFTWTGPYGGGKSSLAIALASLVHPSKKVQQLARTVLNLERNDQILKAFDAAPDDGWTVLPIVGKRASVSCEIANAIDRLPYRRKRGDSAPERDVIAELAVLAASPSRRGVLLVIDELGKFLEHSARNGDDIYFYQELAEAASRARGKLVIVGILHQAFEQYAIRLGRESREEWAKVQGRFIDISLAAGTDETLELIGRAIDAREAPHPETLPIAKQVAASIALRRPSTPKDLEHRFEKCWPLHPVTATLIGPGSKRKFGQNERSVFGFLNSIEPKGFRDFLEGQLSSEFSYYWPWDFWDYLRTNLEPAILASPDGHRWALGVEAVERAESRVDELQLRLAKTVALIELFRNGSGLIADDDVLASCFPRLTQAEVHAALEELSKKSILIYRRHLGSWGAYAGSDFDIEAATANARVELGETDVQAIASLSGLPAVLAKRVYQQKGAMRFLSRLIISSDDAEAYAEKFKPTPGCCGEFLLILPGKQHSAKATQLLARRLSGATEGGSLVVGVPQEAGRIVETAQELFALEHVFKTRTELETDRVAAREISARADALRSDLEDLLRDSFLSAKWFRQGELIEKGDRHRLSVIASTVAEAVYPESPVFMSELICRDFPSSNSVKARRDLMYRMLSNEAFEKLGYEGYPPDAGMYSSILKATTCHRRDGDAWAFQKPENRLHGSALVPLWKTTDKLVLKKGASVRLNELYRHWSEPPFGMKAGVMPIIALAYYMANRRALALYHEEMFVPELSPVHLDEWLQDPSRIEWRFVQIGRHEQELLNSLSRSLSESLGRSVTADSLDSARALVAFVTALPDWTKRTSEITTSTSVIRQSLLHASDPYKVLFVDLPALLGEQDMRDVSTTVFACLKELTGAYPSMLRSFETELFRALDHHSDKARLRMRGETVAGISGDFRLDAFALRLSQYEGSTEDIESIISLAVNKPSRDWTDRDIHAALIQLGQWSLDFRHVETLAPIRNRPASRQAFAVVFGQGRGNKTATASFDVGLDDAPAIASHVAKLRTHRPSDPLDRKLFLAALVELGAELAEEQKGGA